MTAMTARAMFTIPVWVLLDDHVWTSHARHILGGHRHAVPIALGRVRGVPVRVYDLVLGLNVHRHGLRVPVLGGLHVRSAVRVAVSTSRDGGRVMHSRTINTKDQTIKGSAFRLQCTTPKGDIPLAREHECLGGRLRNNGGGDRRGVESHCRGEVGVVTKRRICTISNPR